MRSQPGLLTSFPGSFSLSPPSHIRISRYFMLTSLLPLSLDSPTIGCLALNKLLEPHLSHIKNEANNSNLGGLKLKVL